MAILSSSIPPFVLFSFVGGVLGRFGTWYLRVFSVVIQHIHSYEHYRALYLPTFAAYHASSHR